MIAPSYGLLDLTFYGRQEFWEDSREGWPQRWCPKDGQFTLDGHPTAQWSQIRAARDDDLGATQDGGPFRAVLPLTTAMLSVSFGWSAGRRVGGPVTCQGG